MAGILVHFLPRVRSAKLGNSHRHVFLSRCVKISTERPTIMRSCLLKDYCVFWRCKDAAEIRYWPISEKKPNIANVTTGHECEVI